MPAVSRNSHIKRFFACAAVVLGLYLLPVAADEDDGGFHSLAERAAVEPQSFYFFPPTLDGLFSTQEAASQLAGMNRVRLLQFPERPGSIQVMKMLENEHRLTDAHELATRVVDLPAKSFLPLLAMAADFNHYGDTHECGFEPGVALLIGGEEPQFILLCCFQCHDVHVVHRPTKREPELLVVQASMSPEFEEAVLSAAKEAFPKDKLLQQFQLDKRKRSGTPLPK